MQMTSIQCPTCGAPSHITKPKGSITCEYCGVPFVLEIEEGNMEIFEEGVHGRPFTSSSLDFRMKLLDWLCTGELTPDDILESVPTIDFHGTYVPFWFYTSDYVAEANCKIMHFTHKMVSSPVKDQNGNIVGHEQKSIPVVEWQNTERVDSGYYELLLLASSKIRSDFHPFIKEQTQSLNDFQELIESDLDEHTVGQADAKADALFEEVGKKEIDSLITNRIIEEEKSKQFEVTYLNFTSKDQTNKKVYLPFWMATFEYEDKTYPVIFNGEDLDKYWGEHPVDENREAKFEELYSSYNRAKWITIIFGCLGLLVYILPGLIIFGIGRWYCGKLKKEADAAKQVILDRSYAIRNKAKEEIKAYLQHT